jgi:hypothetical protein
MVQATLVAAIAAAVQFASPALLSAEEVGRPALMIEIDGAIGPATARYVKEALTTAGERRVDVVILRLNTPGGLSTSMREIIADVLGSSVPVIGYVAPSGAHAASAGTYILYATHIAAMAPGTNPGAATPVRTGGPLPGLPRQRPRQGRQGQKGRCAAACVEGCHDGEGDERPRRFSTAHYPPAAPESWLSRDRLGRGRQIAAGGWKTYVGFYNQAAAHRAEDLTVVVCISHGRSRHVHCSHTQEISDR